MNGIEIFLCVLLGVIVLFVLLLIGYMVWVYNKPFPKSGKVIDKWHEEERYWVSFMPIMIGKIMSLIPFFHYDDEDWVITIEDENGLLGDLYLAKTKWQKIKIGDMFIVEDIEETDDPEETREADSDTEVLEEPEEKISR